MTVAPGLGSPENFKSLTEPPYVAALTPVANIAVGDETPWGVAAELVHLLPGIGDRQLLRRGRQGRGRAPGGRHSRRPADAASSPSSATNTATPGWPRPSTPCWRPAPTPIVVEMGVPQAAPRGALHIATHGAARVCGRAAAEVIAGLAGTTGL